MDIKERQQELIAELQKGQARHQELSKEIRVLESNMQRIEGAICLCNEILNANTEKLTKETGETKD